MLLQAQYKDYVTAIILRKNSLTGTVYRDDPTILAWDIANEPSNPGDDSGDILQVLLFCHDLMISQCVNIFVSVMIL